jgi:glycerol-3-phosphate dehydrogenase
MRARLADLQERHFDLLVIGGGIVGACVARDAARRGLSVAIVDKGDFSGGTSAATSKLVHGGLRYLRNFELRLVRESLRERRIWSRIAPHLVHPLPFLMPPEGRGMNARLPLALGLSLYDGLAFDRNRGAAPGQDLPRHRWLDAAAAAAANPLLQGGNGAYRYHDCQMDSPERLGLECILDAIGHGAQATNYVEATRPLLDRAGRLHGFEVRDRLAFDGGEVRARAVVNATGPWADLLHARAFGPPPFAIRRAKGIHLVIRRPLGDHALAIFARDTHLFALPWRGTTVLGTTDTPFEGDPDQVRVTREEAAAFLAHANRALPGADYAMSEIAHAYTGVRPLVALGPAGSTYQASRDAAIIAHGDRAGPDNLFTVVGGKWTTSRSMAERCVNVVLARLGGTTRPCDTARASLPYAAAPASIAADPRLASFPPTVRDRLARSYGRRAPDILAGVGASLHVPLRTGSGHLGAEIAHAVHHELAVTLLDALARRTAIVPLGQADPTTVATAASIMGDIQGWSPEQREREAAAVLAGAHWHGEQTA